jgi:hypothetical protein
MKCPHCLNSFHSDKKSLFFVEDKQKEWGIGFEVCPECRKAIIHLQEGTRVQLRWTPKKELLVYPKSHSRSPIPPQVAAQFAKDYLESCLVLNDSPKASAALSRRCLQNLLREKANISPSDLINEIQQVLDSKQLPSYLIKSIDGVRNIGNFAAHPIKSKNTGEIVDVEPGEAEWLLDTIEGLFDFYFVQPDIMQKKRDELDKKLKDAGKNPMK